MKMPVKDKLSNLSKEIEQKIAAVDAVAGELPGVIIIHNIQDFTVEYMSPRGLAQLGATLEELKAMGKEYFERFFNIDEEEEHNIKAKAFLERNKAGECLSLFQQVRLKGNDDWVWHMTSVKVFMQDDDGNPLLTIAIAFPIDPDHHVTTKVERLLDENEFLRNHYHEFAKLGKRECEVLRLLALGKSSAEIADELYISTATAETHRRNIRQKLKISSFFELSQYARAFDLICYSSFFLTAVY